MILRSMVRWALVLGLVSMAMAAEESRPPNVLFIMSDDHAAHAIGAYGGRLASLDPTPQIDALGEEGIRFDQVFCNNSICTPSRVSIITGQYPQTNGVLDLGGRIEPESQYLPIEMKKAGYQTAMIGKWHLKEEPGAFDYYAVLPGQGKYHDPDFRVRGDKPWPGNVVTREGQHSSDAITDISLEWLKNGRDKERPFFLMHHFKAPHDMFSFAPRYRDYLEEAKIPEPDNLFNPPAGSPGSAGLGSGLGREHAPWRLGRKLGIDDSLDERDYVKACYQEYLKRYLRCVKGVDDNIGRLVRYLRESGEWERTVVIYTSDQGFFLGEHDLMDKRWMYEEAMRMPFIVAGGGVKMMGERNDWLINNTDFAPTILDLAGVRETPSHMQGRSFASALRGEPEPVDWRKVTYYRYWMHLAHRLAVPAHFGIRSKRHKLIFFYGTDDEGSMKDRTPVGWELYDLEEDPMEMKNLYTEPEHAALVKEMKLQLNAVRKKLGETDTDRPGIRERITPHGLD